MVNMALRMFVAGAVSVLAVASADIPLGLATFLGDSPLGRIAELEGQIKPLFDAMPKHGGAGLDAESAKYALQRHFLAHRRWRVQALETGQCTSSSGSYSGRPAKDVLSHFAGIFEEALAGSHFSLRELAALAATVEQGVRLESFELLSTALAVHGISEQELDEEMRDLVIQTFMLLYLLPDTEYSKLSPETITSYLGLAERVYPAWTDTLKWVQDLKQAKKSEAPTLQGFVEEIVFGYRQVLDNQCSSLRSSLLQNERPGTGRVLVSKLRSGGLAWQTPNSIWQFSESNAELRSMGALDESNPKRPTIIIPNYVMADSNCLPSSQIVSTCCMNECNALLTGLEEQLGSQKATPQRIASWARGLGPNVSQALLGQLEELASTHGGSLPIHGKAFAQWLHGAFPATCPRQHDPRGLLEKWWPSARWALRSLALLVAMASAVAGLWKTVSSQRASSKDEKID